MAGFDTMSVAFMSREDLAAAGGDVNKAFNANQHSHVDYATIPARNYLRFEKGRLMDVPDLGDVYRQVECIKKPGLTGVATSCVYAVEQQETLNGGGKPRVSAMKIYTGIKKGSPAHLLTYKMQDIIYRRVSYSGGGTRNHDNILDLEGSTYIPDAEVAIFLLHMFKARTNAAHVLMQRGYTLREALRFGRSLFEALDYLHSRGIVHRDIKPQNVLEESVSRDGIIVGVNPECIQVHDFDVAWDSQSARWMDVRSSDARIRLIGTPGYIAPEVVKQKSTLEDPAMDIYSGTMTLFELITGRGAWDFRKMNIKDVFHKIGQHYDRTGLPENYAALDLIQYDKKVIGMLKAMHKAGFALDPRDRPSAKELAAACAKTLEKVPEDAPDYHLGELQCVIDTQTVAIDVDKLQQDLYKEDPVGTVCMDEDVAKTVLAA